MRHLFLIGLWLLAHSASAVSLPDPFPQVAEAYLVEIDGMRTWEKQPGKRLPPASLTKLMTALLVLERGRLDETVQVSRDAGRESGSRLGLKPGERFKIADLLAATLLQSANDACHALADHIGGSETAFVQMMNRRAQELGLHDTRFRNACGHDADGHLSTAHDLAVLARELLRHPQTLPIASQRSADIRTLDGKAFALKNKNALVGRYDGALGLKTGYTAKAGTCLVALARRDGHEVLLVLLHGKDRWWDAADILDLAFDHARLAH